MEYFSLNFSSSINVLIASDISFLSPYCTSMPQSFSLDKISPFPTTGISKITGDDIAVAKAEGCKIKLIAHAKVEDGKVTATVAPERIPEKHPLAGVSNEFNAVYITGDMVDEVMLYGKGAGALPTGSAIVGDIISVAKEI